LDNIYLSVSFYVSARPGTKDTFFASVSAESRRGRISHTSY
jgi:hypothetical protein